MLGIYPGWLNKAKHGAAGNSRGFMARLCCPLFPNVAAPGPLASAKLNIFGIQTKCTACNQTWRPCHLLTPSTQHSCDYDAHSKQQLGNVFRPKLNICSVSVTHNSNQWTCYSPVNWRQCNERKMYICCCHAMEEAHHRHLMQHCPPHRGLATDQYVGKHNHKSHSN